MKVLKIAAAVFAVFLMAGCSLGKYSNVEDAMKPPRLNDNDTAIYNALKKSVDSADIQLCYPQSGDYRSAFISYDLDLDGQDEVVAIYKLSAMSAPNVCLKILDNIDGEWTSLADISGDGSAVDKIIIGSLPDGKRCFLVGYNTANNTDKVYNVYMLENGLVSSLYTEQYSAVEMIDIDNDSIDDIISVDYDDNLQLSYAKLIKYSGNKFYETDRVLTNPAVYENKGVKKGYVNYTQPAVYLDGLIDENIYITEILTLNKGRLVNLIYNKDLDFTDKTIRENISIMDIDNDGNYEIPRSKNMPGYTALNIYENEYYVSINYTDMFMLTDWYRFSDKGFKRVSTSYVNGSDGYIFKYLKGWETKVSAVKTDQSNEMMFFEYTGDINDTSGLIFKIRTFTRRDIENGGLPQGYEKVSTNGQFVYCVYVPEEQPENFEIDIEEIKNNLIFLK